MENMKNVSIQCRAVLIVISILLCSPNLFAQLSLKNTNWVSTGSSETVSLQFSGESLTIRSSANAAEKTLSFRQHGYELALFDVSGENECGPTTGRYGVEYEKSGQLLSFYLIQDDCISRSRLFGNTTTFTYLHDERGAARNWLQLDPDTDSIAGISLEKAYELLKGRKSRSIVVAVIDNGVDIEHEDLKDVIWTNTREIPDNGVDDDHNGYVDDVHGWNFRGAKDGSTVENEQFAFTRIYSMWKAKFDNAAGKRLTRKEKSELGTYIRAKKEYLEKIKDITDPTELAFAYDLNYDSSKFIGDNPLDPTEHSYGTPFMKLSPNLSHGTHVAGIIAAQRNNLKGIDGIADNVRIMPILATTASGDERDKDVANAIRYAVNNGARVINMSFSKSFSPYKSVVDEAIRYAEKSNVLIVHAAGNDGSDIDLPENYHYPIAIYENGKRAANFITVGWSRPQFDYRLAHPYSDYGLKNVDIFAPGSDIFSTVPDNSYDFKSASSMSTPVVSGVAALLFSYFPSLSAVQVKDIILRSSLKPTTKVNRPGTNIEVPFQESICLGRYCECVLCNQNGSSKNAAKTLAGHCKTVF